MRLFTAGPLLVRALGGDDDQGGGDGPAFVLCHGFTAPGDELVHCAERLRTSAPRGTRFFLPEGPLAVETQPGNVGRAFWDLDVLAMKRAIHRGTRIRMIDETPPGMTEARDALAQCIANLSIDPARTLLGGFSQGAMVSTELVLFGAHRYAGLALLSGTMLSPERWGPAIEERGASLHVLMTHGEADTIIPIGAANALHERLRAAGATVEMTTYEGGHVIGESAYERLGEWVKTRLR